MSMDYWEAQQDAAYDSYLEELYEEEFKERAIEEFTEERLRSYFLEFPHVAQNALAAHSEAKTLLTVSPSASLVFSAIAIEVGIKAALLKPVVCGLIHSEATANLISDFVLRQTGIDRFRKLIFAIVKELSNIDLRAYVRPGATKNLWEERAEVQRVRNNISHRGQMCITEDAEFALEVASSILERLLPDVLHSLGLCMDSQGEIIPR